MIKRLYYAKMNSMTDRQRRALDVMITLVLTGLLAWGFWSFFQGQAVFTLFSNDSKDFQNYLANTGGWAMFTFLCLVILEVLIAFIPGWVIYPVGAALFGFTATVSLVMVASFIGASLSFWIGRRWGKPLIQKFVSTKYINQFDAYMEKNGSWALFFLKLNPVTSFDLWNYLAGASAIGFWKFSIANLLGIFPLIMFSAALGQEGYNLAPQILGVLLLLTLLYVVWYFVNLPEQLKKMRQEKNNSIHGSLNDSEHK